MARTDIAGLLTGIPSGRPDPMGMGGNASQQRLAFGAQRAEGLQRGVRGMMGQDPRTTSEKLQMAMASLDLSKPEDLRKLAGIQQATGDLAGAAKTAAALRQVDQDQAVRLTLIKRAKTAGNDDMVEFLTNGGDIGAATTILFRQAPDIKKPSDAGLTDNEIILYDSILGKIDPRGEDYIPLNELSSSEKTIVFQRAEEAVSAARDAGQTLTREQALRQVLKQPLPTIITDDEFGNNFVIK
jgi:hypothetical protein